MRSVGLFVNFVYRVFQSELNVLTECQPWQDFFILRDQVEILGRAKLNADTFGIGMPLNGGVDPLLVILEKGFPPNELTLLRILHQA